MNIKQLQEYSDAWNQHNIDNIMEFMTEDCIFETGGGAEKFGTRYEGSEAVRGRDRHVVHAVAYEGRPGDALPVG